MQGHCVLEVLPHEVLISHRGAGGVGEGLGEKGGLGWKEGAGKGGCRGLAKGREREG